MKNDRSDQSLEFRVRGLDCADCAVSLEKALRDIPGVGDVRVVYATGRLSVRPDTQGLASVRALVQQVQRRTESMGYALAEHGARGSAPPSSRSWGTWLWQRRHLLSTILSALLLASAFVLQRVGAAALVWQGTFVAAIVVGGFYLAKAGWLALRTSRSLDMNVLMTVAALGAIAVGELAEGAVTVLLFSVGELLEGYTSERARNAIRSLMELAPSEATVLRDGQHLTVPVEQLAVGDRVLVRPGERLPADGQVIEGRSAINQAPITGESIPVDKGEGSEVFAGTINGLGALTVEVSAPAQDSTIARILRLVEEAQSERAPTQRLVDRFARVYTPIVLGVALLVATVPPLLGLGALSVWVYRALVLLVIACPCALVLSTPVTIVSALTRAARAGVLIKGGRHLEALAAVRVFALDKTGTLTLGDPYVVGGGCELHPETAQAGQFCDNCDDLLAKAAALEGRSEHALARAVTRQAHTRGLDGRYATSESAEAHAGLGIDGLVSGHRVSAGSVAFLDRGAGNGGGDLYRQARQAEADGYTVLVIEDACCDQRCYLTVADGLRSEAAEAIRELKRAGVVHTVMLTGDNRHIAQAIARRAGVDDFRAELLPLDKVRAIESLEREYGPTAMVGDGVNDAPALAKATVGVAMGAAGTDTALETADVALMGDDLDRLPFAIRLSRAALNIVRANVALALAIKGAFMLMAVAGVATLWMAVIADTGAAILVILNGMRMLRYPDREAESRPPAGR